MKTWGPETRTDCFPPSTFDDRMRGSSGGEGPGWLADRSGWAWREIGWRARVEFRELQNCKAFIEQVACV